VREAEVLDAFAGHLTNAEIAARAHPEPAASRNSLTGVRGDVHDRTVTAAGPRKASRYHDQAATGIPRSRVWPSRLRTDAVSAVLRSRSVPAVLTLITAIRHQCYSMPVSALVTPTVLPRRRRPTPVIADSHRRGIVPWSGTAQKQRHDG
jgi:hypothetical protein